MKLKHMTNTGILFFVAPMGKMKPKGPWLYRWLGTRQPNGFMDVTAFGHYENGEIVAAKHQERFSMNPELNVKAQKHLGAEELAELEDSAKEWQPQVD